MTTQLEPGPAGPKGVKKPLSARNKDLIDAANGYKFTGRIVSFPDGAQWQIQDALSDVMLYQGPSPCVARQTFNATCISDPSNVYTNCKDGVIKIDFQILASTETMQYYNDRLVSLARSLEIHTKDRQGTQNEIKRVLHALEMCRSAYSEPGEVTFNERFALRRFADRKCYSAPWLFDSVETEVEEMVHFAAIEGGYMIYMLMPKMPGKALSFTYLQSLSLQERDEIREAFKTALMEVWHCGIKPMECGSNNILWEKESKSCCTLSFGNCLKIREGLETKQKFTESEFKDWGLDENRFKIDTDSESD